MAAHKFMSCYLQTYTEPCPLIEYEFYSVSHTHLHAWYHTNLPVRCVQVVSTKLLQQLRYYQKSLNLRYENNIDEIYIWRFGYEPPIRQILFTAKFNLYTVFR